MITSNGKITIYWQHEPGFGIAAFLPDSGFDFFDSLNQLDLYCITEWFGYEIEYIEVLSEQHRLELEAKGAFNV